MPADDLPPKPGALSVGPTSAIAISKRFCAHAGRHKQLAKLLKLDPDPECPEPDDGRTLLMAACGSGHAPAAKLLLKAGSNPDARAANQSTALMACAASSSPSHAECAKLLLPACDIGALDKRGRSAEDIARKTGAAAVLGLIVEERARRLAKAEAASIAEAAPSPKNGPARTTTRI